MTSRYDRIFRTLETDFTPLQLDIEDESRKHAGHAARNGLEAGETHYRLTMVSEKFAGMPRLARSRAVHAALDAEFKTGLHALALTLKTPEEAK